MTNYFDFKYFTSDQNDLGITGESRQRWLNLWRGAFEQNIVCNQFILESQKW